MPQSLVDEVDLTLERVTWNEQQDLTLDFTSARGKQRWQVTCIGSIHWRIEDRQIDDGIRFLEDHPFLWRWRFAQYSLFFNGRPDNPYAAAYDLLDALPPESGVIAMEPNQLVALLRDGYGSLGAIPVPAIGLMKAALAKHNVTAYELGPDQSSVSAEYVGLSFGNRSWIIAERFLVVPLEARS